MPLPCHFLDDSPSLSCRKSALLGPVPIDRLSRMTVMSVCSSSWSSKVDTKNLTRYCYSKTCNRQLFLWWCIMRQVVFLPTTHRELQILSHFSAAACTLIAIVTRPLWQYEHAWKRVLIHRTLWMSTIFMCSNYSRHWPNFLVSIKGNTVYTLTWLRPLV